jgi:hypothetical protein
MMSRKDREVYDEARDLAIRSLRLATNGEQYVVQQSGNAAVVQAAAALMKACKMEAAK